MRSTWLLAVALPAFAKRTSDYVPPQYPIRVGHAFLALVILAVPALIIAIALGRTRTRVLRGIGVAALIAFAGALIAARDARNDELWEPAYSGGVFAAAALPAAVAATASRIDQRRISMIVMAAILAFPLALLLSSFGQIIVLWLAERGLPVTW